MITSANVAKKLGISMAGVRGLVERKLLKDYGTTKNGGKRHEFKFKAAEVNEFKKVYKPRIHSKNYAVPAPVKQEKYSPAKGIMSRMDRIERELTSLSLRIEHLITMWE